MFYDSLWRGCCYATCDAPLESIRDRAVTLQPRSEIGKRARSSCYDLRGVKLDVRVVVNQSTEFALGRAQEGSWCGCRL